MTTDDYINDMMARMFLQAHAQFGDAVKTYWVNAGERCPGCDGSVDLMRVKGEDAVSLNAFIYRERGVLIGYLLCSRCARKIFRDAKRNPGVQTSLHTAIETTLSAAYDQYRKSTDA